MSRDSQIDGLRGLSVLMVILIHAMIFIPLFCLSQEEFQAHLADMPAVFLPILGFDRSVDIFFILSAYLLSRPLFSQIEKGGIQYRRFFIARAFRVYPIYLLLILPIWLFTVEAPLSGEGLVRFLQNILFIDNFFFSGFLAVSWSLAVEMQFYFALPFLVVVAYATGRPFLMILGFLGLAILGRAWALWNEPNVVLLAATDITTADAIRAEGLGYFYYNTVPRVHTLILGMIWAFVAHRGWLDQLIRSMAARPGLPLITFISSLALIWFIFYFPFSLQRNLIWELIYGSALSADVISFIAFLFHRLVFCVAVLAAIFSISAAGHAPWGRFFSAVLDSWLLRTISRLSFTIYLLHLAFLALAAALVFQTVNFSEVESVSYLQIFLIAVLGCTSTALVSWPLYRYIETPMINLGKRLGRGRASSPATT